MKKIISSMGKTKRFKGLVRILPANLINIIFPDQIRTARVKDPFDMYKKGLIVLKINPADMMIFNSFMAMYKGLSGDDKPDIELDIKIKGKARTMGQNALYWALVSVLALEVYQENGWEDVIHEELLKLYAPSIISKLHQTQVPKRSKDMDTAEFTRLIEGVFHEINQNGVSMTEPADLDQYWKNYAKIRFSGGKDHGYREGETLNEYRQRVNYCEGCRKYLRPGSFGYEGNLAHIVSRGSGGEDETWNIFHLCTEHHLYVQHQKGWEAFFVKFPHLKAKFEIAQEKHEG